MNHPAVYIPSADEPSIFGTNPRQPSTEWMMWRSHKASKPILAAFDDGMRVLEQLTNEAPREVGSVVPKMIITNEEFSKAGIRRRQLSLAWVIYTKYALNAEWGPTHEAGINMLRGEIANG